MHESAAINNEVFNVVFAIHLYARLAPQRPTTRQQSTYNCTVEGRIRRRGLGLPVHLVEQSHHQHCMTAACQWTRFSAAAEDPSVWTVMNATTPLWRLPAILNVMTYLLTYLLKTWTRTTITRRCWSWRIQLAGIRPLQHPPNHGKTCRVLLCRVGWIISSSRRCWLVMRQPIFQSAVVSMITFVAYLQQSNPYIYAVKVDIRAFALSKFSPGHFSWLLLLVKCKNWLLVSIWGEDYG